VHGLPMKMTVLDDDNNPSSRDMTVEQDVLPEAAGAFGTSPETVYWANMREGCSVASVRLAFWAEGMKDTPRTVVLMGTRLKVEYPVSRGIRLRRSMLPRGDGGVRSSDSRGDKSPIAKAGL
jgi:hypothetical protein